MCKRACSSSNNENVRNIFTFFLSQKRAISLWRNEFFGTFFARWACFKIVSLGGSWDCHFREGKMKSLGKGRRMKSLNLNPRTFSQPGFLLFILFLLCEIDVTDVFHVD